jgi:histone deacetylase complex regulatory component SIN3
MLVTAKRQTISKHHAQTHQGCHLWATLRRQGPVAAPMPAPIPQEQQTSNVRGAFGQGTVNKRAKTGHTAKQTVPDGPPVSPTLTPALPEPIPPTNTTTPHQDELAFFDRVKKFIGNKNTMNEFLKLCNLYSQDLIDKQLLLYRVQSFIGGNPELFAWFKKFMGAAQDTPQDCELAGIVVELSQSWTQLPTVAQARARASVQRA